MPDANGTFKGISVPALPWLQRFEPGDRVRIVVGDRTGHSGTVLALDRDHYVVEIGALRTRYLKAGELRRAA